MAEKYDLSFVGEAVQSEEMGRAENSGEYDLSFSSNSIAAGGQDQERSGRPILDRIAGAGEVVGNVASSVVAEPIAGLSGIAAMVPGGATPTEAINATRNAMRYEPRTEAGREYLRATGRVMQPVGEAFQAAEDALGNAVFEKTGSPTLAAAAVTLPTLITELVGVGAVKKARGVKAGRQAKRADAMLREAAPSKEQIKEVASGLYREIDEMGAIVNPDKYQRMVADITREVRSKGLDPDITPMAQKAIDRLQAAADEGVPMPLRELDTLREVAKGAADDVTKPKQNMLSGMIVDRIDEFMGQPGVLATESGKAVGQQVKARYKTARDLWGRMRRSELIEEAVEKAGNQASGFENGLRIQLRSILNNKKQRRFFQPDELEAISNVVKGTTAANTMKLLGKFGFGEQQATNMLGGYLGGVSGYSLGSAAGGPVGGFAGAAAVAGAGSVARRASTRMTKSATDMADAIIRAGRDGRKIAAEYMRRTANPDPAELAELFLRQGAEIADPSNLDDFTRRAAEIAAQRQAELAGAAAAGATERGTTENVIPFAVGQ